MGGDVYYVGFHEEFIDGSLSLLVTAFDVAMCVVFHFDVIVPFVHVYFVSVFFLSQTDKP